MEIQPLPLQPRLHSRQYLANVKRTALATLLAVCTLPAFAQNPGIEDPAPQLPESLGQTFTYHPLPATPRPQNSQFPLARMDRFGID